jgi:serine/threonine-protein kinase
VASNLYWQRSDGAGEVQRLTDSKNFQQPGSWHPSGRFLAFEEIMPATASSDLMILPMDGDETSGWKPGTPRPFLSSPFQEREPMFSPDGRWLAYISNESGRDETYVRPFPGPGGKWQVSNGGGATPTWSQVRPELLYGVNRQIMAVTYTVDGDSFRADKPRLWSPRSYISRGNRMFDLHPDGTRVAMAVVVDLATKQDILSFFFNFFDELRRIAPVAKQ